MSAGCPSALQDHRFTQPEAFHCCGNQRGLRKMGRLSDRWSAGDGFPRSPDRASDRPQNHRQDLSRPSAQRGRQFGLKEESGRLPPISAPVAGQSVTPPLAPSRPPNWPPLSPPPTGYAVAWRIDRRATQAQQPPEPLRLPAPLNQLPWDVAKDHFGVQGADFIGVMGSLIIRVAKDHFRAYLIDPTGLSGRLPLLPEKTSPGFEHTETRTAIHATGVSPTRPALGASAGSPSRAAAPVAGVAG